jgi:Secretion system C-terminal sorting domain
MKKLLNLIFILVSLTVFSQTQNIEWEQTYGGSYWDVLRSTIPTSDGGYLLGGRTSSTDGDIQSGYHGGIDCWVVKINSIGTIEWEQTYGGSNYDEIHSTIPTSDGGYLIGGYTESYDGDIQSGNHGVGDFWVVKINSTGAIEWEQTYGGTGHDLLNTVITTSDGGYFLGGETVSDDGDVQSGNQGGRDFWAVKINGTGTIEWEQTYGGSSGESISSIISTFDGGCLLGGTTYSNDGDIQSGNHGGRDYWVVKINSTGTIEWEQTYGGTGHDLLNTVITTSDGAYLLGGETGSNDGDIQSGNHGEVDCWAVKINSIGTIEWEQTYGGSSDDYLYSTVHAFDGGYLLGGETGSNDGNIQSGNHGWWDYWIVKINSTGTIEWEQTYGGSSEDWLSSTNLTSDGAYLLGGYTFSNDGDIQSGTHGYFDFWVVKISGTTGTYESYNENIKIYPNPVKDKLFVNLENVQLTVDKILLFNSTGKLVFSSEGTEIKSKTIEIPTLNYNTGLYNLNLYTKQGVIQRKIVIVR